MRMAVTGASGFVGRHVIAALLERGVAPVVTLRPNAPVPPWLSGLEVVRLDISQLPADPFAALGQPDVLMHLAWGGLPDYRSPRHVDIELPEQASFLQELIARGLGTLVVTGTCFEYGMQSGELKEDVDTHPATAYGTAKDALRRLLEPLCADSSTRLTWARLFYIYGEGQSAGSLLPQLKRAVAGGKRAFDMSGGEQQRDYLPVSEAATHLISLALSGRAHGVVNVCSGKPVTVRALVECWIAESGWSIRPNLGVFPYPDYEPMAFWGDAARLHATIDPASHKAVAS